MSASWHTQATPSGTLPGRQTPPLSADVPTPLELSDGRLPPGRELDSLVKGRYQLLDVLGSGGMAVVYRARDTRLGQDRAIKVMRPELAHESVTVERFEHEAMAMARVDHPNLVRVHDIGRDGPHEFMVMELVTGGSVHSRLANGEPVELEEAGPIVCDVLGALGAAHAAGVVHRDVKPANVLLTDLGRAKVTDFGVARLTDTQNTMTHTGVVLGTLSYMAPEQHIDARSVDGRADIYATGALLYAMLTRRKPYALHQEELDSDRWGDLPEKVRDVIYKATRFKPDDRYPTASAMATAIRAAMADPEGFLAAAARRRRRQRIVLAALVSGGVTGLFAGGLIVGAIWLRGEAPPVATPGEPSGEVDVVAPEPLTAAEAVESGLAAQSDLTSPSEPESAAPGAAELDPGDPSPDLQPAPARPALAPDPIIDILAAPEVSRPTRPVAEPTTLLVNSLPPSTLEIDGRSVGSTRFRGTLAPGKHTLVLRADGHPPVTRTVHGNAGETVRICWDFGASAPCRR